METVVKTLSKKERLSVIGKEMPTELPVYFELLSNDNVDKSVYILDDDGEKHYMQLREDRMIQTKSTIQNALGRTETIRYIAGVPTVFQDEQKRDYNIDPNYKPSYQDLSALKFVQGELMVEDYTLLEYLWYNSRHNLYQGRRNGGEVPLYRLKEVGAKEKANFDVYSLKRKAVNRIAEITDEDNKFENFDFAHALGLLYKINGSYSPISDTEKGISLQLIDLVDSISSETDPNYILITQTKKEDLLTSTDVVVGYALKNDIISLTQDVESVSMKNNSGVFETAFITGGAFADFAEKIPLFIEHLQSAAGVGLLQVLRQKVSDIDKSFTSTKNTVLVEPKKEEPKIVEKIVEISKKEDLDEIEKLKAQIKELTKKTK